MCVSIFFLFYREEERLHKLGIGGAAYTGSMCRREKFGIVAPVSDAVRVILYTLKCFNVFFTEKESFHFCLVVLATSENCFAM